MQKVDSESELTNRKGFSSFQFVFTPTCYHALDCIFYKVFANSLVQKNRVHPIMKAAVAEYMKTVQSNVLKGFRVPVGDQFLTVYPNLNASVKDVKDKEGKVTVATAKMLTANKGKSRLGASVSIKFFASKAA